MVTINISGPVGSGKGYVREIIIKALEHTGYKVHLLNELTITVATEKCFRCGCRMVDGICQNYGCEHVVLR